MDLPVVCVFFVLFSVCCIHVSISIVAFLIFVHFFSGRFRC